MNPRTSWVTVPAEKEWKGICESRTVKVQQKCKSDTRKGLVGNDPRRFEQSVVGFGLEMAFARWGKFPLPTDESFKHHDFVARCWNRWIIMNTRWYQTGPGFTLYVPENEIFPDMFYVAGGSYKTCGRVHSWPEAFKLIGWAEGKEVLKTGKLVHAINANERNPVKGIVFEATHPMLELKNLIFLGI